MPYIGPNPAESFTSFATQEFSTSATTSYTLDHAVANENEIALFVNNVRQQPGSGKAYTATGTALTLSAATASTDTMYCVFLGRALQTVTPATNSITAAMVSNDLISGKDALTSAPASTDEFLVSDAGVLKRIDASLVGRGKVLQVVTGETTTNTQITSSSYADTSLTADITPSATSSKILVLVSQNIQMERATYEINTFLQLLRDSTTISIKTVGVSTGASNSQGCRHTFAISHLDEPSTTSAITYKTQGKINDTANSGTCRFQEGGSRSEIVLIEIAG
jgi:hypothetical protein